METMLYLQNSRLAYISFEVTAFHMYATYTNSAWFRRV